MTTFQGLPLEALKYRRPLSLQAFLLRAQRGFVQKRFQWLRWVGNWPFFASLSEAIRLSLFTPQLPLSCLSWPSLKAFASLNP